MKTRYNVTVEGYLEVINPDYLKEYEEVAIRRGLEHKHPHSNPDTKKEALPLKAKVIVKNILKGAEFDKDFYHLIYRNERIEVRVIGTNLKTAKPSRNFGFMVGDGAKVKPDRYVWVWLQPKKNIPRCWVLGTLTHEEWLAQSRGPYRQGEKTFIEGLSASCTGRMARVSVMDTVRELLPDSFSYLFDPPAQDFLATDFTDSEVEVNQLIEDIESDSDDLRDFSVGVDDVSDQSVALADEDEDPMGIDAALTRAAGEGLSVVSSGTLHGWIRVGKVRGIPATLGGDTKLVFYSSLRDHLIKRMAKAASVANRIQKDTPLPPGFKESDLKTSTEIATLLGTSEQSITTLARKNIITSYRRGPRHFFLKKEVIQRLEAHGKNLWTSPELRQ